VPLIVNIGKKTPLQILTKQPERVEARKVNRGRVDKSLSNIGGGRGYVRKEKNDSLPSQLSMEKSERGVGYTKGEGRRGEKKGSKTKTRR